MVLIEELPLNLLDNITSDIISTHPSLQLALLSALGKTLSESTSRVTFGSLSVPDDNRYFHPSTLHTVLSTWVSPSCALLLNPKRYGRFVTKLTITDPIAFAPLLVHNGFSETDRRSQASEISPQSRYSGLFGFDEDSSISSLTTNGSEMSGITSTSIPGRPVIPHNDRSGSINSSFEEDDDSDDSEEGLSSSKKRSKTKTEGEPTPISARNLYDLLRHCPSLEELIWASNCPPPNGLCEAIARACPRLCTLKYNPTTCRTSETQSTSSSLPKWDCPSLPVFATSGDSGVASEASRAYSHADCNLPTATPMLSELRHNQISLSSLTLTRLSQLGARFLSLYLQRVTPQLPSHLSNLSLSEGGSLHALKEITFDFVWLDDSLCEKISTALGKTLKRLSIGTKGTKLTDKGVIALLEGCEALEEFSVVEVEGRLSKTLWSKFEAETLPLNLHTIRILLNDSVAHHSWTFDHLLSLPSFPLSCISKLCVRRVGSPPSQAPSMGLALSSISGSMARSTSTSAADNDLGTIKRIPREIMRMLVNAPDIKVLECDWWSWSAEDLKIILEHCPRLEEVNVCLDAPFPKLLSMAGSIASAQNLQKLHISITPEHAPSPPPSPSVPTPSNPLSPDASPFLLTAKLTCGVSPSKSGPSFSTTAATPLNITAGRTRRGSATLRSPVAGASKTRRSASFNAEVGALAACVSDVAVSPNTTISSLPTLDPALPPLRDIKKIFKRCSKLEELEWIGRGTWVLLPSSTSSKLATSLAAIKVEFVHSPINSTHDFSFDEIEAARWGWTPPESNEREGWKWDGPLADAVQAELQDTIRETPGNGGASFRSPTTKRRPSLGAASARANGEGTRSRRTASDDAPIVNGLTSASTTKSTSVDHDPTHEEHSMERGGSPPDDAASDALDQVPSRQCSGTSSTSDISASGSRNHSKSSKINKSGVTPSKRTSPSKTSSAVLGGAVRSEQYAARRAPTASASSLVDAPPTTAARRGRGGSLKPTPD